MGALRDAQHCDSYLTNGRGEAEKKAAVVHTYTACEWICILKLCDTTTRGLWNAGCALSSSCLETGSGIFRKGLFREITHVDIMIYNDQLWIAVCPHRSVPVPKEHNSFGGYSYRPTVCQP